PRRGRSRPGERVEDVTGRARGDHTGDEQERADENRQCDLLPRFRPAVAAAAAVPIRILMPHNLPPLPLRPFEPHSTPDMQKPDVKSGGRVKLAMVSCPQSPLVAVHPQRGERWNSCRLTQNQTARQKAHATMV